MSASRPPRVLVAKPGLDGHDVGAKVVSAALRDDRVALLQKRGADDVLVLVGGVIPDQDVPLLEQMGVHGIFPQSTPFADIVAFVRANARSQEAQA